MTIEKLMKEIVSAGFREEVENVYRGKSDERVVRRLMAHFF